MKTLFISDQKSEWEFITNFIRANFPKLEVICVISKEEALNVASFEGPFGFLMVDAEVKDFSPSEITQEILDVSGVRPVLFLGREAFLKDRISQEIFGSHENNVLIPRPYDIDQMRVAITNALGWAEAAEFEDNMIQKDLNEFIPIKIKSFYYSQSFAFDVYLEVTTNNFVKIIAQDKPYSLSLLQTYARKNVKFLYLLKTDHIAYLENEIEKFIELFKAESTDLKEHLIALLKATEILGDYIKTIGVTETAKTLTNQMILLISNNEIKLKDILKSFPILNPGIASKSLLTAFLCNCICNEMHFNSAMTKNNLILASILQDIALVGKDELCYVQTLDDPTAFDPVDQELIKNHTDRAGDIASQFTGYSDIEYLIVNHHELPNRKGFPRRLTGIKLTGLCCILVTSQYVASHIDGQQISSNLLQEIIAKMNEDFTQGNFKEPFKTLKKIISQIH
jgi:HD-GYP domain-containing protein (c-di-GMP phosphodiesterase class II)